MSSEFLPALKLTLVTFALCGLAYPLVTTGIAQVLFPRQANGSLIAGAPGRPPLGSELIGQEFKGARWFHGRPSAVHYDARSGGASNLGPTNQLLIDHVAARLARVRADNPTWGRRPVPADYLTSSGSGLDPDISIAAARLQAPRVARARGLSEAVVGRLIARNTTGRDLGLFGEPRVNVLELNLALGRVWEHQREAGILRLRRQLERGPSPLSNAPLLRASCCAAARSRWRSLGTAGCRPAGGWLHWQEAGILRLRRQ